MRDEQVFESVERELNRQRNNIELIASENFVSKEILELAGSVLTNKYAEGYPGKRYYGGCQFVDEVETLAINRLKELFGCEYANVQPHSGAQANTAVYLALLNHGDKVLGMSLADGGHLTHGHPLNYSGINYEFYSYGVSRDTETIDYDEYKRKVEEIFSGQVLCLFGFDDLKVSKGHIQIFEKEFLSSFSGWKAEYQIQTENEAFQNRFQVYAEDEHNAYYILTPQRMEKIMEFADAVEGQISLVFYDEKLFAAVKRESMFDAVMDEPVSKQTEYILEDADFIQKAKGILIGS